MSSSRIYKYLSKPEYVEAFLGGLLYCNALQHFRTIEHDEVQGDPFEGIANYAPTNGLQINNVTRGDTFVLSQHRFESSLESKEIYVCCLSREFSMHIARRFKAHACIEIVDVPAFCELASLALPEHLVAPTVRKKPIIGHRVRYYDPSNPPATLWALPELIAISKHKSFDWQKEFRLVFGAKDSFEFESAEYRISSASKPLQAATPTRPAKILNIGDIKRICRVHYFDGILRKT